MSVPPLAPVSARTEDPHPEALQCQFPRCSLALHVSPNNPFVDAPTCQCVCVRSNLRIALLSPSRCPCPCCSLFLLVLVTLARTFALATFALSLACHGVNVHWRWSRMIWSPLPAHCQKRLNARTVAYLVKVWALTNRCVLTADGEPLRDDGSFDDVMERFS